MLNNFIIYKSAFKPKKRQYLPHYWSEKGLKSIVVNRTLSFLHRGSLEIMLTVSLIFCISLLQSIQSLSLAFPHNSIHNCLLSTFPLSISPHSALFRPNIPFLLFLIILLISLLLFRALLISFHIFLTPLNGLFLFLQSYS